MSNQPLFTPYRMGDLDLPNRIVMAPLTRMRAAATSERTLEISALTRKRKQLEGVGELTAAYRKPFDAFQLKKSLPIRSSRIIEAKSFDHPRTHTRCVLGVRLPTPSGSNQPKGTIVNQHRHGGWIQYRCDPRSAGTSAAPR
jgi:hypothetical protein